MGSSAARLYVLQKSIECAVEHPIFGVGPGQFPDYEGQSNTQFNGHGYYHGTHNTFTQVASECGIPAMLLFTAGLVATYRLLSATYRKASQRPDCQDIRDVAFCLMLSMVGFGVAMTFLNFAYFFYQPALAGLAIAVSRAAEAEFGRRSRSSETAPV
jgi:O-antigen ligase